MFELTSLEFQNGDTLDKSYQADQDNQSPALSWKNPPEGTKSFAIAMHDPDAPTGGAGWWHWLVFNLPANLRTLPRHAGALGNNNLPQSAIQMKNDGGERAYMGCYPPEGDPAHRYIFTIYALDCAQLDIDPNDSTSKAGFIINAHSLAKAQLTAYYAR